MEPSFTLEGRPLRKVDGYTFVLDKTTANEKELIWQCQRSHECRARHRTDLGLNFTKIMRGDHSHPRPERKHKFGKVGH